MISLQLLGGLALRLEDPAEADALLAQPKPVALLAYLALERPGAYHRRDLIVALLWPDADQDRARNSLRQALHRLRQGVGAETVRNRGSEEVGLTPGTVTCDASAFLEAAQEGRWQAALEGYAGDLLPGFHVPGAPEFMDWLEAKRVELRGLAVHAARVLADQSGAAGRFAEGAGWAARGLAVSPLDASLAERRIRLLDQGGDRRGALAEYDAFTDRVRRELGLDPDAALAALATEIRQRRGVAGGATPPTPSAATAPAPYATARAARRAPQIAAGLAAVGLVLLFIAWWRGYRAPRASDPGAAHTLVILPFRVAGADPDLGYLREGMVDLLAAKLTGEAGGLRAIDPRTALTAWHSATGDTTDLDPARAGVLARDLGAGRVLLGGIVGRASRLMLQVAAYDARTGAVRARGTAEGPTDSLPELVDQLAAQLLSGEAGGLEARSPVLAGTPLRAVRAYLEGEQAYRAGRYAEAFDHFLAALAADSTYGPAAVGVAVAGIWYPTAEGERQRGLRLGWAARDRLGIADRTLLVALAGPRYPAVSPWRERLDAWERAVAAQPGRPEAWYEYGDILMHRGPVLGIAGSAALAERAFARAVALDSSYAPPISHLFELGAARGDTAMTRAAAALFLARDSTSELSDYLRWRRARMAGDPRLLAAVRRRFALMPTASLGRIVGVSQLDGLDLEDAIAAMGVMESRPLQRDDQVETLAFAMELALNRGRPTEARDVAATMGDRTPGEDAQLAAQVLNALYADGDSAAGARIAARFAPYLAIEPPATGDARALHLWKACAAAEWRAWHGATDGVAGTITALRRLDDTALPWWAPANQLLCAARLEAIGATLAGRPEARALVLRLDSLTLTGPDVDVRDPSTLALARLWRRLGEPARAVDAYRRRQYHHRTGLPYLATRLREEGGAALAAGDTASALAAWRRFLTLYADPAPVRRPAADSIRGALEGLAGKR